jgi:hypothetical protein
VGKESEPQIIELIVYPGKWVAEEQLIALKGIKKGTLKKARVQVQPGRDTFVAFDRKPSITARAIFFSKSY